MTFKDLVRGAKRPCVVLVETLIQLGPQVEFDRFTPFVRRGRRKEACARPKGQCGKAVLSLLAWQLVEPRLNDVAVQADLPCVLVDRVRACGSEVGPDVEPVDCRSQFDSSTALHQRAEAFSSLAKRVQFAVVSSHALDDSGQLRPVSVLSPVVVRSFDTVAAQQLRMLGLADPKVAGSRRRLELRPAR